MTLRLVFKRHRWLGSKRDILGTIDEERLRDLKMEDKQRYPLGGKDEPRWVTLMCWARSTCADLSLIARDQRDNWGITTAGFSREAPVERCVVRVRHARIANMTVHSLPR